jgi:Protein of unknown function (DUF3987)
MIDELPPVEPFDIELLPKAFQPYAVDSAELMQVPLDFIGVPMMVFAGAAIGRQVGIHPQRKTNWVEYPNMWGGLVGSPGLRKSAAINAAGRPFRKLGEVAEAIYEAARARYEKSKEVLEISVKVKRKKYEQEVTKAYACTEDPELPDAPAIPKGSTPPQLTQYSTAQVTQEALLDLLIANPRGMLVERDELVTLLQHLDRTEYAADRSLYLTGWNAKDGWSYNTLKHGLKRAEAVTISVLGTTQPAKLMDYVRDALAQGGGDGMLARFGMLVWPDTPKDWQNVDRQPNAFAMEDVTAVFERLAGLASSNVLHFDDKAQEVFYGWYDAFEPRMRKDREHPAVTSHLAKFTKLVPGLALICALVDNPEAVAVDPVSAARAVRWASYLESHVKRIYTGSLVNVAAAAGRRLVSAIRDGDLPNPVTGRDIQRKNWSGLAKQDEITAALEVLLENGLIVQEAVEGKKAPRFRLL